MAAAAAALGETAPPVRILRGELTAWQMRGLTGDMTVRVPGGQSHACRVTPETYITREIVRITPVGVKAGDSVEVVGDYRGSTGRCAAITIYIRPPEARPSPVRASGHTPIPIPQPRFLDNFFPRGLLTYAGTVLSQDANRLVVRTRKDGEKSFVLRNDTIFSQSGREVEPERLKIHTSVFVRAGQTFDGTLEVYQVIWGDILKPGPAPVAP